MSDMRDRILGSRLGGAVGGALSEPVEFMGLDQIRDRLGRGWVGEEAVAVYSSLATGDFRDGVLLAVNHSGDSDSTASIAGQIFRLINGFDGIPNDWLDELRLRSVVERIATDLRDVFHLDRIFSTEECAAW